MRVVRRLVLLMFVVVVCCGLAFVIHAGIQSRQRSAAELRTATLDAAVPTDPLSGPSSRRRLRRLCSPAMCRPSFRLPSMRAPMVISGNGISISDRTSARASCSQTSKPRKSIASLIKSRADLATAQANYKLAQSTAARYQNLLKSDSVSRQDTDEKIGDMEARKAVVDSAAANVRRLEETVRFQKVYAPFDGVITARNVDTGALINSGANAPGKELFDLSATDRLRVFVNIPQTYLRSAVSGAAAYLTAAELPGRQFAGRIVRNSEAIDPASRTLLTEVDVDNHNGALLPGQYVSRASGVRRKAPRGDYSGKYAYVSLGGPPRGRGARWQGRSHSHHYWA